MKKIIFMKAIIKVLLFVLAVVLLCQCKKEIEPKTVTIPDNNFLNALIEPGVDTNGDGIISHIEAIIRTSLDVRGKSISWGKRGKLFTFIFPCMPKL